MKKYLNDIFGINVKIEEWDEAVLETAFNDCTRFSSNGKLSVEEYVEMSSLHILDGDICKKTCSRAK